VLHIASGNGQIHLADYYLKSLPAHNRKQYLNAKTTDGLTPAHFAANMENMDIMSLLLEYGADLTLESEPNHSVFAELITRDHADLLGCVWHL